MTAQRIVVWRHGQTALNVSGRIQGAQDHPLNDTGRTQAREIAPQIVALNPTRIVSSPLSRAFDTAQEAAALMKLPVETDPRLRERSFGVWEGLNRAQIQERYPEQFAVWNAGGQPEGVGVETKNATGIRFAAAAEEHAAAMDGGTLLIVAHGAAIAYGTCQLLGLNADEWMGLRGLDNCHWGMLIAQEERVPRWRLVAYNRLVNDEAVPNLETQ